MKASAVSIVALFLTVGVSAQHAPDLRFKGHTLGESAEAFFSMATTQGSKVITKGYCKSLLDDSDAMKRNEATRNSPNQKDFLLSDVGGCQQVMAALRGERAQVGARLASELGKGRVSFASGKLMAFQLFTDSPYDDAIADMTKRLGIPGEAYTKGPAAAGMQWKVGGVVVLVFKFPYHDEANVYVGYADQPIS